MSFFLRISSRRAAAAGARLPVGAQRGGFATSSMRMLKESDSNNPDANEAHKQDSLKKQKAGKGEWKKELASDSEEAVAADRSDESIADMQKNSADKAEKEKGK